MGSGTLGKIGSDLLSSGVKNYSFRFLGILIKFFSILKVKIRFNYFKFDYLLVLYKFLI